MSSEIPRTTAGAEVGSPVITTDGASDHPENPRFPDERDGEHFEVPFGAVRVVPQAGQLGPEAWRATFGNTAKDFRYYELCEQTLRQPNFDYRYLLLTRPQRPRACASAGFFHRPGPHRRPRGWTAALGGVGAADVPAFCQHEDAHGRLHGGRGAPRVWPIPPMSEAVAGLLEALEIYGRRHRAAIITFKDFPREHRPALDPAARQRGFVRMPSFPATVIPLHDYTDFDDYLARRLSHGTRKNLRRKFRDDADKPPVTMEVRTDVSDMRGRGASAVPPGARAQRLPFRGTHEGIPRPARPHDGRAGAVFRLAAGRQGGGVQHLPWFTTARSTTIIWAWITPWRSTCTCISSRSGTCSPGRISQGLHTYYSTPLNYDPKLHLRFDLEPLDLYVRHLSRWSNPFFKRIAPLLEPTRHDKLLRRFGNYADLA